MKKIKISSATPAPNIYTKLFEQVTNSYREGGVFKRVYYVLSDWYFELKYNIRTKSFLDKTEYDDPHPDSIEYVGARYVQLNDIFKKIPIQYGGCSLLDLGCGKGRAIAVAATHPFRNIIGVEYDQKLALSGQNNIANMRNKTSTNIKILCDDATTYDIPKDINVIYMFNPFIGETLDRVIANIRQSYEDTPRKIHIIFLNHDDFDQAIQNQSWISKISTLAKVDGVNASLYATS